MNTLETYSGGRIKRLGDELHIEGEEKGVTRLPLGFWDGYLGVEFVIYADLRLKGEEQGDQ